MSKTKVVIFRDGEDVPLINWLLKLPIRARLKCLRRIERLEELGHELRRPEADFLRDGIYELRVALEGINYRMLYFFHGQQTVILSHGLVKQRIVPPKEIALAIKRKKKFKLSPDEHSFEGEYI